MKHIFVINPLAGRKSVEPLLRSRLQPYLGSHDIELHVTAAPGDASDILRLSRARYDGPLRFYACGGDGTLGELVNGAYGLRDTAVGCYPCGSGNDYVKYYGGVAPFLDLDRQFAASVEHVDLMRVGSSLAINMVDFGLDSKVAEAMERVRRKPLLGGPNAYVTGVVAALLQPLASRCKVWADSERLNGDRLLLCTVACGQYVGGSYRAAPRSDNADGLLEVCLAKPLSRLRLLQLMGPYRHGRHLDDPRFRQLLVYRQARRVRLKAERPFTLLLDGEIERHQEVEIEVLPRAMPFLVPKGAARAGA